MMIDKSRNIYIQKQTHTSLVSRDELADRESLRNTFGYLFVRTMLRPNETNPIIISNSFDNLTDRSYHGSAQNGGEMGETSFSSTLILTPSMVERLGDKITYEFGFNTKPGSNRTLNDRLADNVGKNLYADTLSFYNLTEDERNEILSHLVIFSGDVKSEDPLTPLFIGDRAAVEMQKQLKSEGRFNELNSVINWLEKHDPTLLLDTRPLSIR